MSTAVGKSGFRKFGQQDKLVTREETGRLDVSESCAVNLVELAEELGVS